MLCESDGWFTSVGSSLAERLRSKRRGGVEVQGRMVTSIDFVVTTLGTENPKAHERRAKGEEASHRSFLDPKNRNSGVCKNHVGGRFNRVTE